MSRYQSQSKYCYPGTDVLINKLDIRDLERLEKAERIYTGIRMAQIELKPIPGDFDLKHMQKIHKHIFQDLYEFSGRIRDETIWKGTTQFASPLYIESNAKELHK